MGRTTHDLERTLLHRKVRWYHQTEEHLLDKQCYVSDSYMVDTFYIQNNGGSISINLELCQLECLVRATLRKPHDKLKTK